VHTRSVNSEQRKTVAAQVFGGNGKPAFRGEAPGDARRFNRLQSDDIKPMRRSAVS